MKKKKLSKKKAIMVVVGVLLIYTMIVFVLDLFNVPSKIGINTNINIDIWDIYISNAVVILLFTITFLLFDRRNLEKDRLATYAGIVLLIEVYNSCQSFYPIFDALINNDEIEPDKQTLNEKARDYMENTPFANNDKIFDLLTEGSISKESYEQYSKIKKCYGIVVFSFCDLPKGKDLAKIALKTLVDDTTKELDRLEKLKKEIV